MAILVRGMMSGLVEEIELLAGSRGRESLVRDMLMQETDRRLHEAGRVLCNASDVDPNRSGQTTRHEDLCTLYEIGFLSYPFTESRRLRLDGPGWKQAPATIGELAYVERKWADHLPGWQSFDDSRRGLDTLSEALASLQDIPPPFPLYVPPERCHDHEGLTPVTSASERLVQFGLLAHSKDHHQHRLFLKFVTVARAYVLAHWRAMDGIWASRKE